LRNKDMLYVNKYQAPADRPPDYLRRGRC
jgi:hypothetical protein